MKRVVIFVGSGRKQHTYNAAHRFGEGLKTIGDVEYEVVPLSEHRIETCRGCRQCMDKGEAFCPLKDDRDLLIAKIMAADGVVLATPNYSFQVSGFMKVFLDRLGFLFHRPRMFGKTFTDIVVQGIHGGGKIVKYLDFVGYGLGFNGVKGCVINSLEPMTEKQQAKNDRILDGLAQRFHARLMAPAFPAPKLLDLMIFRMARTSIRLMLEGKCDYLYYKESGWFESDFYYPTRLGPVRKAAGRLFDSLGEIIVKTR